MADLDALLRDEPAPQPGTSKLQSIIDEGDSGSAPRAVPSDAVHPGPVKFSSLPNGKPLHWTDRFVQNFNDATIGVDQLRRNVLPESVNTKINQAAASVVGAIPFVGEHWSEAYLKPRTTEQQNQMTQWREKNYQEQKKESGLPEANLTSPSTWDMAGITGSLANPINWAGPKGEAASALGRIALAARNGAIVSLWQPVTESGDYWSNKAGQVWRGLVTGGLFAAGAETLKPVLSYASKEIGKMIGKGAEPGAASVILDDAMQKAGVKPEEVPQDFKAALADEVVSAAKSDRAPDPHAVVRQTRAASVGLKLSEAQALQDPNLYAAEQKLRGVSKGNDLTLLERANQTAAINKLSEWGAGGIEGMPRAPDTYKTAQDLIGLAKQKDDALTSQINQAYAAVRNSQGQAAKVDHIAFSDDAIARLKQNKPALYDLEKAAPEVLKVVDEIGKGEIPFTVEQLQSLDKWLGRKAYSQTHGDISSSINIVRQALNDAPISDSIGQEAAQAYQVAKGMARDRFQLLDKDSPHFIPAFKAAVEDADPGKFFDKHIVRGNVRDIDKLLQFMPEAKEQVGNTFMRHIQESVVNGPLENGTFSESKLGSFIDRPENVARAEVVFGQNRTQQLLNLRQAAADAFRPPRGTDVPSYKTGKSLAGLQEMAGAAADYVLPGKVRAVLGVAKDLKDKATEGQAARKAAQGLGVTKPVPKTPPKLLSQVEKIGTVPLAILATKSDSKKSDEGSQ